MHMRYKCPELYQTIEEIERGSKTSNRCREVVEPGDYVVFFAAKPATDSIYGVEESPDADRPLRVSVQVSEVKFTTDPAYPTIVKWVAT